MSSVFALIDCNNFFVSCERLFRPDLEGKPVVVLSSNDGCAVSRSNEAKQLGIPMGTPGFQLQNKFNVVSGRPDLAHASTMQGSREARREPYIQYGERALELLTPQRTASFRRVGDSVDKQVDAVRECLVAFSANFELYGNISRRITEVIKAVTPQIEVYSVDESFLDISSLHIKNYTEWGQRLRAEILKNTGIPVSIGIATSKTLAKLGSEVVKHDDTLKGAIDLVTASPARLADCLANTPIEDIWGIGRRLASKLRAENIHNAWDVRAMRPQYARQLMGIHGRQLVAELNGTSCYPLETNGKIAKSILRSHTFGEDTHELYVLESAIANLTARAMFRLREANLLAGKIGLFMNNNRYKPGYHKYTSEATLGQPTGDSGVVIAALVELLQKMHNPSERYHRLGVFLTNLTPASAVQTDLAGFIDIAGHDSSMRRMAAIDAINNRYGKDKLHYAAEDLSKTWQPMRRQQSPRYLSRWTELPTATIKA